MIDGERFAQLIVDHDVGVSTTGSYEIKKIDSDYFDDHSIRKQILWESPDCSEAKLSGKEVEYIRENESHNPDIGYNRWPKWKD